MPEFKSQVHKLNFKNTGSKYAFNWHMNSVAPEVASKFPMKIFKQRYKTISQYHQTFKVILSIRLMEITTRQQMKNKYTLF